MTRNHAIPQCPPSAIQRWLIAYDITHDKRLKRVGLLLKKSALPMQYSVWLFKGTITELQALTSSVLSVLNEHEDDLRIYGLGLNSQIFSLGQQFNFNGNTLIDPKINSLIQATPQKTDLSSNPH